MTRVLPLLLVTIAALEVPLVPQTTAAPTKTRFAVTFGAAQSREALDGRLLVMISSADSGEPRFQINDGPDGQLVFGIDVDGWAPGRDAIVDGSVLGFPLE